MPIIALLTAKPLLTKSVKHRNELANSVGEMNYRTDASDESEEQDLETNWNPLETASLEDSLSTGVKRSKKIKEKASAGASSDSIVSLIASVKNKNNGRLF